MGRYRTMPLYRIIEKSFKMLHRFYESLSTYMNKKKYSILFVRGIGTLALTLFVVVACEKKPAAITPDDRKIADSLVSSISDIDSLALLQNRLEREGNTVGSIIALREWGKMLRNESRFDEALNIHSKGLRQAKAIGDTLEWVQALNNIGTDYRRMGVLDAAQGYHYRAWMISKEYADTSFTAMKNRVVSLNGLGNIYMTLGNFERADSVLRLALRGEQQLQSALGQGINYANLGSIFEHRGQMDSAWVYFRLSMKYNQEAGSTLGISLCHTNFGSLYEREGQYDKAIEEYQAAYRLMQASKDEWHALTTLIALAGIYNATHDDTKTMSYLATAQQVAKRIGSKEHLAEIHTLYYNHYKQRGDYRKALAAYEQAEAMQDSMLDMEKMNRIQNVSLDIERNRQTREMNEARLKLEQERTARHTGYVIFAFIVMMLMAALATFLYIQRVHRRNHLALKRLSTLRENFFTNITHEFRTPLTVLLGLSRELQESDSPEVKDKAKTIERQGKGLLVLINQLLDISKIKSSVGDPDWRSGNVTAHLAMIIETYRAYADSRNIDLQLFVKEPVVMDFVPDYFNKVMNNLLSNAFKFTPEYGRVSIATWREDDRFHICVTDTGQGMDKETQARIFEPFYQGENDVRGMGTGVGLALVKQIVDAVEGNITVESEIGKGTTFYIDVPIHNNIKRPIADDTETNRPILPEAESTLSDSEGDDSQCRLLIIEDNNDIAAYIGSQFANRYAVSYAANGKEGLEKALQLVPDLIITDLMMPGMDGLEVCRQVRGNEIINHIPIIVVTAKITEEERVKGIEAGADAYLAKPFNADELHTRVEKLLDGRRLLREKFARIMAEHQDNTEQDAEAPDEADLRFLRKVSDFVNRQLYLNKDVGVSSISERMCMSSRQFYRKINALTGYTPSAYILRLKIKRATNLIDRNPEISFGEVADRSGFSDYSNFVRAFKNMMNITPTEYRNRIKI